MVAATLLSPACTQTCPCGADLGDPVDAHDLDFAGEHIIEEGCLCRCGPEDDLQRWSYDGDGTCEHPQTECRGPGDRLEELDCS